MNQLIVLTTMVIFISLSGFTEEVTVIPTDDIAIGDENAMIYNAGDINNGSNDTLTIMNFKC